MAQVNCSWVRNLLADYSVNGLGWRHSKQVRKHLRACADCDREYRRLMAATDLLNQLPEADPPDDLWESVRADIPAGSPVATPRRLAFVPTVGLVTAAALAALLAWTVAKSTIPQVRTPESLPMSSARFYVHNHLAASDQDLMLSGAAVSPVLYTADAGGKVADTK